MINDKCFTMDLINKILKHKINHEDNCLKVCPLIINRYEMNALIDYCKMFTVNAPENEDVYSFYGVRLIVED